MSFDQHLHPTFHNISIVPQVRKGFPVLVEYLTFRTGISFDHVYGQVELLWTITARADDQTVVFKLFALNHG